jgi:ribonucleoside-diphosphate reductase alpha chain
MEEMIEGDAQKRKIWAKVLESRSNTGYPYIFFVDNANNNTVDCYKDKQIRINHSNLCTEIMLPNNEEESFVCCLSSMNILHYDEWKDTNAVELMVCFLDAVMEEFIEKASKIEFMQRTVSFAKRHRALGLGWLGWHSYLQSKMIPWESMEAKFANVEIAKNIKTQAYEASAKLAQEYGEPDVCKGYGRRNSTLLAIAPTKSCTTPDTKFKDSDLNNIDYFEFAKRGGLDLHDIMSIEVEFDNEQIVKYRYDEMIKVERSGENITIMACNIAENDIL